MTEQLEFSGRTGRLRHGLVVAGLLSAVALLLYFFGAGVAEDHQLLGLALLILAGATAIIALRHKETEPDLLSGGVGLWCAEWRLTVPWTAIEDCYVAGSRLRPYLALKLKDPDAFAAGLRPEDRERLTSSPYIRLPELRIPANAAGNRLLALRDHVLSKIGEDHG